MYVYEYGSIGKAIRTKIDGFKQNVKGKESSSATFSEVLKAQLNFKNEETRVVSATGNNSLSADKTSAVSGSTLLYALQNSDEETTAGAVLSALGFTEVAKGSDLKNAADALSASTQRLADINAAGTDPTAAYTEFVSDFNKMSTLLSTESSSSAYLYKNALAAILGSNSEELSAAGLTAENGILTYTGGKEQVPQLFLSNIASTAAMVSSYAGAIKSESETGVSEYYSALMNMV